MNVKPYEAQLVRLGFSDKEAKVYIASLEMGPAPVQRIAEKSGVKRATAYVMIESLMDRGLMSSFQKGKKSLFVAESPKRLLVMLENEKKAIERKRERLKGILGDLLAFTGAAGEHAVVSYFEGLNGLTTLHQEILTSRSKDILNIVSLDDAAKIGLANDDVLSFREQLLKKRVNVRIIYTSSEGEIKLSKEEKKKWDVRMIASKDFPLHGEITIFGDKVAAFSYKGKILATLIESKEIAQAVRVLFSLAWKAVQN